MVPPIMRSDALVLGGRDDVVAGKERAEVVIHVWIPHSVLVVPAQRPLRGSSPGATRRARNDRSARSTHEPSASVTPAAPTSGERT